MDPGIFITQKNYNLILGTLYDYFTKKHNYKIGKDEEEITQIVMERVFKQTPRNNGETMQSYIKRLMISSIQILKQAIYENITTQKEEVRPEDYLRPQNSQQLKKDANETNKSFADFEKQRREEFTVPQPPKHINFEEKIDDNDKERVKEMFAHMEKLRNEEAKYLEEQRKLMSKNEEQTKTEEIKAANGEETTGMSLETEEEKKEDTNNSFGAAPISEGQRLLLDKPKEFQNLVENNYKYNNNFIKHHNLVIDSRDRNISDYPNNYNYQIDFDEIYKSVTSIELVSASLPKTEYLINNTNNTIYFSENGGDLITATIPTGNYTEATLATAIETVLETAGTDTYTVSVDTTLTNKYTITKSSGTLELFFNGGTEQHGVSTRTIYKDNSIGRIIGFSPIDLSGAATYTGQNQYNLNGPSYVLLKILNIDNLEGVHNKSVSKSFAKIPLDTNQRDYKFFKAQTDYIVKKVFQPPLSKLSQLNIEFRNYDNSFYDFGGLPHCLYFKIDTLNQDQSYFNI